MRRATMSVISTLAAERDPAVDHLVEDLVVGRHGLPYAGIYCGRCGLT